MALIRKPENYNGADPEAFGEWFDRFKLIATVNAWDNPKQLAIIPTLLTQHAYRIFKELDAEKKDTLDHIKENMTEKLLPKQRTMVWKMQMRALKRTSGESVDEFVFRLRKLAEKAYQGGDAATKRESFKF